MRLPAPTPGGDSVAAAVHATIGAGEAIVRALVGRTPSLVAALGAPAMTARDAPGETAGSRLTIHAEALVYELLDAHADTAELAAELWREPQWAAHLDYLRALQRIGRETLAQMEDRT